MSIVHASFIRFSVSALRAVVLFALAVDFARADLPPAAFQHVNDYTYSCWANGWRDASRVFSIQTSRYGLAFDYNDFDLLAFGPLAAAPTEQAALTQRHEDLMVALNPPLVSDSFNSGTIGQTVGGKTLNNALGGRLSTTWTAPPSQTPLYQAGPTGHEVNASYDCTLAGAVLAAGRTYSLSARVNPPDGMDGSFAMFSGLGFKIQTAFPEFWAESGAILRIFNDGGMDIKYGKTGGGLAFTSAGSFNPAADYDASGYLNVRIDFSGAGTAGSPLQVTVFVNGRQRGTASINNLVAGDRVGFTAPYGGQFDDFILRDTTQTAALTCTIKSGATSYNVTSGDTNPIYSHIVETGKYFQRRYQRNLNFAAGAPALNEPYTGLEFASWPDRLGIILRARPTATIASGALEITLDLPDAYNQVYSSGTARALLDSSGAGFIIMADSASASLSVSGTPARAVVSLGPSAWSANADRAVGFVIYPVASNGQTRLAQIATEETTPLVISAQQLAPLNGVLTTGYNRQLGMHNVNLRDDGPAGSANDRIERVAFSIANPTAQTRTVRLNFRKAPGVYGVTGVSAMLRDSNLFPTGIPVQHSKNWHATSGSPERYEGGWWHGLTMLAVPPQTTLNLEYDSVNAHWGGLPAASHAQLSLVGYGGNQQWDEAAMGSWGESITFDPDVNLQRSMIDDVRPLLVTSLVNSQYEWTNNVGGGDFLVYYNGSNQKQWNSRMKTRFTRYSPNKTEVTYAGQSADGKIDLACTASIFRSDDYLRVLYHMRYDVKQPVTFNRLAFLQVASDNYSDGTVNKMAYGNADGLTEEWTPVKGGLNYSRSRVALPGRRPWISMHNLVLPSGTVGASANRSILVHSWNARLNGANSTTPHFSVWGSQNGPNSAIAELSLPPGVNALQPGDFVDAWVSHIILPQHAVDYYGPNANLEAALNLPGYDDSWPLLRREADKNDIDLTATQGVVEQVYPPRIRASGNRAVFDITGGIGYMPVTLSGLSRYSEPMLYESTGGGPWVQVDQSLYGNDFWQTDYNAQEGTWEITYNVPLDTPGDVAQTRNFIFQFAPYVPVELAEFSAE